jgi:hypothetical protein
VAKVGTSKAGGTISHRLQYTCGLPRTPRETNKQLKKEGLIEGRTEVTGIRGRRRRQSLDNLKGKEDNGN